MWRSLNGGDRILGQVNNLNLVDSILREEISGTAGQV